MFKWFIFSVILLFFTHHRVIKQMTERIDMLQMSMKQLNETYSRILDRDSLYKTSVRYLKKRVDEIDLHMAALENLSRG